MSAAQQVVGGQASARARPATQITVPASDAVYWWALAGLIIVTVSTQSWLRWMMSDGFVQPDPGPDP